MDEIVWKRKRKRAKAIECREIARINGKSANVFGSVLELAAIEHSTCLHLHISHTYCDIIEFVHPNCYGWISISCFDDIISLWDRYDVCAYSPPDANANKTTFGIFSFFFKSIFSLSIYFIKFDMFFLWAISIKSCR